MKNFISKSQKTGELGEDIACIYLKNNGFSILERNYTRNWGEIDVIAKKSNKIYFIEVKSTIFDSNSTVSHVTNRPEENMHSFKQKRLSRIIETYLIQNRIGNVDWQVDLLVVYIDKTNRISRVNRIENIIL